MDEAPVIPPVAATVEGNRIEVLFAADARLAALIDLIDSARTRLQLVFYIMAGDATAKLIGGKLADAARRGVRVSLLIDGFGSADLPDLALEPITAAGVHVARFLPSFGRRYLLRNHQKIAVADGARAVVGGANIADAYFTPPHDPNGWSDIAVSVEGEAAARLGAYCAELEQWMATGQSRMRPLIHVLKRRSDQDGAVRWLFNGPFPKLSPLTLMAMRDIDRCSDLAMMQAYFAPNWGMLRRLGRVTRRGGSFTLLATQRSDNRATVAAARHCYRRLLRRGARIFEYLPQRLHAKMILADDAAYLGSANFDMRSLFVNAEVMLRVEDKAFADALRGAFEAFLPACEQVTRESHRARSSWFARARWLLAYFVVSTFDFTVTRRVNLRLD